jgi:hypothetical protein
VISRYATAVSFESVVTASMAGDVTADRGGEHRAFA